MCRHHRRGPPAYSNTRGWARVYVGIFSALSRLPFPPSSFIFPPLAPQVEYLTAALSVTYKFMDIGNEYANSDARILAGSLRLLCSQFVDSLCADSLDYVSKLMKKDLWEVCVRVCVCACVRVCVCSCACVFVCSVSCVLHVLNSRSQVLCAVCWW